MYLLHPGAGLHGHEYSPPSEPSNPRSISPRVTLNRPPYSAYAKPRPTSFQDTSRSSSIRPARRLSPTRRRTINERVSFVDPDTDTMSDDAASQTYSDGSEVTPNRRRRRRPHRHTSTSYYLAHPAPTLTQKQRLLHIRPKLLLQLQRLSVESRPIPTIDVMSSATFVPRLAKKFPSLWRGELGINDVMIVKSDDYSTLNEEKELDEAGVEDTRSDKEIRAIISQSPKDVPWAAELCLEDGSKWNAAPGPKGVLEMVRTDPLTGERTVARWVPRGTSRRNSLQTPSRGAAEALCDQRYQFSFIDPNTRRHPVLATLTQGMLKISDTYSPLPTSSEDHPPISSTRTSTDGGNLDNETSADPKILTVDESQRLLIEVSAIWVVLRRGWCHLFRYEDASPRASSKGTSPSSCSSKIERTRSFSLTPSSAMRHRRNRSDTVTSIPESIDSSTGTFRSRRNGFARASLNTSTFQYESDEQVPRRPVSTGAAFMQKAAARRVSRPPSIRTSESESGSRPGSRSSSPKLPVSAGIADGVRISDTLAPSPVRQYRPSSVPSSPTKMRRSLSAYGTEQIPNQSHLQTGGQTESQVTSLLEPQRRATGSRTPGKPSSNLSEKKRTGKWSCLLGLFRRHHSKRR